MTVGSGAVGCGRGPIVIVGISRRSGTNFLARLLALHPDCTTPPDPVKEDFLLVHAGMLVRYAHRTASRWPHHWGDRRAGERALVAGLGRGLVSFLTAGAGDRRVVTKTPGTTNLACAPALFPDADLVLLLRDGRAVAQSVHTGYRRTYTGAIRMWRRGARDILRFERRAAATGHRHLTVRYEDVVERREPTLREVFAFCGLDPDVYDFAAAGALPVTGSSHDRTTDGGIDWTPQPATGASRSAEGISRWPEHVRQRFDWLAGDEQRALGYPAAAAPGLPVSARLRNAVLDALAPAVLLRDGSMWLRHRGRLLERRLRGRS